MKTSIAIIGGGPSSLMLAATLNESLFDVTIYDHNSALGRKFLVAGDGGFNLTHSEDIESFISRYTPSCYLEKCIRFFNNNDLQAWLKQIGIDTFIGSSKRVFPLKHIKPIQVLSAFLNELKTKNIQIKTKHEWKGWNQQQELVFEHNTDLVNIKADIIVFGLGGASWSKTGTDGTWTRYFENQSIKTLPFQPSNCGYLIKWQETFMHLAEGKPLKNITVSCNGKQKKGEIIITKFGIEGGAIYALSPQIREQLTASKTATVFIDLKPSSTIEVILNKLQSPGHQSVTDRLKKQLNFTELQISLIKSLVSKDDYTNAEKLASLIKALPLSIHGMVPIEEAISSVGGIDLSETDDNFQLKQLPNHYVIGEMLNWDAPTGGYLLQACFSMGNYLGNHLNQVAYQRIINM